MKDHNFTLRFALPADQPDPETFIARLQEGGCNDATIGVGKQGYIALDFTRAAESLEKAQASALDDVMKAIPGAQLI